MERRNRARRCVLAGQKGQSMTAYALVLLFVMGLGLLLAHSGLGTSIRDVVAKTAAALHIGKTYSEALAEYGTMSNNELMSISNQDRIAIDREALTNLSRRFLGMTKSELYALLGNQNANDPKKPGLLLFDYDIVNTGDEAAAITVRNNGGHEPNPQLALEWMKGNYDDAAVTGDFSRQIPSRVLFSNDTILQEGAENGITPQGQHSSTIRAKFTFNGENGTVDSVTTTVWRNIQVNGGDWQRDACEGLKDIVVTN